MNTQEKTSKSTFLDRRLTKQFDLTVALIALAILLIILIADKAHFIRLWSSAFRPGFTRMLATTSQSHVEEVLAPERRVLNLYLLMLASIAFHFAKQAFSPRREPGDDTVQIFLNRNTVRGAIFGFCLSLALAALYRRSQGAGFPYFYGGIPFILAGLYMVYDIVHFRRTQKVQEETPAA